MWKNEGQQGTYRNLSLSKQLYLYWKLWNHLTIIDRRSNFLRRQGFQIIQLGTIHIITAEKIQKNVWNDILYFCLCFVNTINRKGAILNKYDSVWSTALLHQTAVIHQSTFLTRQKYWYNLEFMFSVKLSSLKTNFWECYLNMKPLQK